MDKKRDSFFLANKQQKKNNKVYPQDKDTTKKNYKDESKNKRQENFNQNRPGMTTEQEPKKPFDKKTYRLKKYSKKYKLDQYEEQRKKKLLKDYYKDVQNDPVMGSYRPISFDKDNVDGNEEVGRFVRHPDLIKEAEPKTNRKDKQRKDPFSKAKQHYEKVKQDKADKQKETEKAKEEKQQKLMEYKKKKQERFKKLSKKTKKGQPVMTGRLEMLLDKIQKSK